MRKSLFLALLAMDVLIGIGDVEAESVSTPMMVEATLTVPPLPVGCSVSTDPSAEGGALVACDQTTPYTMDQVDPSPPDNNITTIQVFF